MSKELKDLIESIDSANRAHSDLEKMMATKLIKPVSREVNISDAFGHEGPVIVTLSNKGIEVRRKGSSRKIFVTWKMMQKSATIPENAPAKYCSNPFGWLVE